MLAKRRLVVQVSVAVVGVLVAIPLVLGSYGWTPKASPEGVQFNGVHLNITYSGSWPGVFGPASQNACLERPSILLSDLHPNCPARLVGGIQYDFVVFVMGAPNNVSWVFVNATLRSPIPINADICRYGVALLPPTLEWNLTQEYPTGSGCGIEVIFTMPNPAPAFPSGLWMDANLTVHVV